MIRLSVVVPAFNEAGRLGGTLDRMFAFLAGSPGWRPAEVIVVDDGSSDETAAVARRRQDGGDLEVVLHTHSRNLGKGAAVRTGFAAARGQWTLLSDADLATPIEELELLAAQCGPGCVAIGSRAVDRGRIEVRQPLHRDLMGRTFNLAVRLLAVGGVRDTQCGFKLFPGALARALAGAQRLDGFAYDVELLLLARYWGYRLVEVPVRWRHVEASRVSPVRHSTEMLHDLLRLAARRLVGRLPARPASLASDAEASDGR